MKTNTRFFVAWVALSALGMATGVLIAAQIVVLAITHGDFLRALPSGFPLIAVMLVAGAGHGLAMGATQSVLLRARIGVSRLRWTLVTGAVAAVAWMLGASFSFFDRDPWTLTRQADAIVIGGACLGALVGAGQWLVLRRHVSFSYAWIPINSLAWIAGTGLGAVGIAMFPSDPTPLQVAIGTALATLVPGAAVGALTGAILLAFTWSPRRAVTATQE